jgi:hypothetical protein
MEYWSVGVMGRMECWGRVGVLNFQIILKECNFLLSALVSFHIVTTLWVATS